MQFPIGGTVRERKRVDPVRFRDQQYSLDGRRCVSIDGAAVLFVQPDDTPVIY